MSKVSADSRRRSRKAVDVRSNAGPPWFGGVIEARLQLDPQPLSRARGSGVRASEFIQRQEVFLVGSHQAFHALADACEVAVEGFRRFFVGSAARTACHFRQQPGDGADAAIPDRVFVEYKPLRCRLGGPRRRLGRLADAAIVSALR
ncbi:hypothetical protein [Mesorhizobium silamurunense]|uniref:hypothetical protein n=1 Tax=Mesorhizobium silamurunense TaxID=499528 RepID=UPI0017876DFE|nr:hypothetical protein [Mesorhizobium silamurunense]